MSLLLLQAIQQEMEDGLDKKGDAKDFEEKLAEQLFADEGDGEKIQVSVNALLLLSFPCCAWSGQRGDTKDFDKQLTEQLFCG